MSKPTFKSYAEEAYLPLYNRRRHQKVNIESGFKTYSYPLIGDIPLDQITPLMTGSILEAMYAAGRSDVTIANHYRNIKRVFQLAISKGIILRNPCTAHFNHHDSSLFRFPEDISAHERLMSAIEKVPLRNFYGFCYMTGISIMELRELHEDDYDSKSRILRMDTSKHPGRYLISDLAIPFIEAEIQKKSKLNEIEDNLLFVTESGSHIPHTHTRICTHVIQNLIGMPEFTTRYLWMAYGNMLHLTGGDNWQ